jgi:DNA-binding response OmpR family regulator
VRTVASLAGGPAAARDADVIVLHCDGAKKSSIDLLVKLHRLGFNLPVVLLTGRALPSYECLTFDKGAVDVISKSRGSQVLARRLKCVVEASRRTAAVRQIHDLRQAASASRCQPGLLEGRRPRPHSWRIQHRPPDGSNVGQHPTYRAIYDRLRIRVSTAEAGPVAIG